MDLQTVTDAVAAVVVPLFAVTSMVAVGLRHTVRQFLGPLRDVRLVVAGLATNFVAAPLVALAAVTLFRVPEDVRVGLVVLACAAGAPFALQLSGLARADMAVSSSLLAVMLLVTVAYMPLVLPLLLPGTAVGAGRIATVLLLTMLLPLLGAVLVRQFAPRVAAALRATAGRLSLTALVVMLGNQLVADHRELAGLLGTGAVAAILTTIVLNFGLGWLFGGPRGRGGPVLGISASQRNMGAATVIVVSDFGGSTAVPTVVLTGFLALLVLLPVARWLGRGRAGAGESPVRVP